MGAHTAGAQPASAWYTKWTRPDRKPFFTAFQVGREVPSEDRACTATGRETFTVQPLQGGARRTRRAGAWCLSWTPRATTRCCIDSRAARAEGDRSPA